MLSELLNEDYDSYVITPWAWNGTDGVAIGNMCLIPIAFVTLVTNVLVIATFVREKMMSALNVILIGISVSDTLTVLIPTIATLFMYFDGIFPVYIPFEYCRVWSYLTKYLPTITHNASVWLTFALACDRYVAIRHPFLVRRLCLPRTSVTIIVVVYICATLGHICRFIDTDYVPVKIISTSQIHNITRIVSYINYTNSNVTNTPLMADSIDLHSVCDSIEGIETCRAVYTPFFADFELYEFCYYWFVILFVKFIPCTGMIILDSLMIKSLRHAEHIRHIISTTALNHMQTQTPSQSRMKYYESKRMTVVVIIAIVIVIIVELPIGIILIFWTLAEIHDEQFITEKSLNLMSRVANFTVYFSYPLIFLLYCCISARFRAAFCRMCCCVRHKCPVFGTEIPTQSNV